MFWLSFRSCSKLFLLLYLYLLNILVRFFFKADNYFFIFCIIQKMKKISNNYKVLTAKGHPLSKTPSPQEPMLFIHFSDENRQTIEINHQLN